MDKCLRVFAGAIIFESALSKSSKLQLLNFIQNEATDAQVKTLLMDGEIVSLDEHAEEIVNARFEVSEAGGKVAQMRKSIVSVGASPVGRAAIGAIHAAKGNPKGMVGAAVGAAMWGVYRAIRSRYDKCTKQCGTFKLNLPKRQYCVAKCNVGKIQAQLNAAMKSKNAKEIAKQKTALAKAKQTLINFNATLKDK